MYILSKIQGAVCCPPVVALHGVGPMRRAEKWQEQSHTSQASCRLHRMALGNLVWWESDQKPEAGRLPWPVQHEFFDDFIWGDCPLRLSENISRALDRRGWVLQGWFRVTAETFLVLGSFTTCTITYTNICYCRNWWLWDPARYRAHGKITKRLFFITWVPPPPLLDSEEGHVIHRCTFRCVQAFLMYCMRVHIVCFFGVYTVYKTPTHSAQHPIMFSRGGEPKIPKQCLSSLQVALQCSSFGRNRPFPLKSGIMLFNNWKNVYW